MPFNDLEIRHQKLLNILSIFEHKVFGNKKHCIALHRLEEIVAQP